jgi:hypothetical protein
MNKRRRFKAQRRRRLRRYDRIAACRLGWSLAKTLRVFDELHREHQVFKRMIERGAVGVVEF